VGTITENPEKVRKSMFFFSENLLVELSALCVIKKYGVNIRQKIIRRIFTSIFFSVGYIFFRGKKNRHQI